MLIKNTRKITIFMIKFLNKLHFLGFGSKLNKKLGKLANVIFSLTSRKLNIENCKFFL
jgi:hypothetical protein